MGLPQNERQGAGQRPAPVFGSVLCMPAHRLRGSQSDGSPASQRRNGNGGSGFPPHFSHIPHCTIIGQRDALERPTLFPASGRRGGQNPVSSRPPYRGLALPPPFRFHHRKTPRQWEGPRSRPHILGRRVPSSEPLRDAGRTMPEHIGRSSCTRCSSKRRGFSRLAGVCNANGFQTSPPRCSVQASA